jgi:hypothetical protein
LRFIVLASSGSVAFAFVGTRPGAFPILLVTIAGLTKHLTLGFEPVVEGTAILLALTLPNFVSL